MKDLIWDNTLSIEVDEIDDDHRKLVDLFNLLNHALADGAAQNYVEAVLEELISCTAWHFRHEERLMLKHGYAGYDEHKAEHQLLIDSARELQKKFLRQGMSLDDANIIFLEHWLTGHILGMDMDLGKSLSKVM